MKHSGVQVEARWALAEWGRLPLNPTLYGEWKFNDHAPDAYFGSRVIRRLSKPTWSWEMISVAAAGRKPTHPRRREAGKVFCAT